MTVGCRQTSAAKKRPPGGGSAEDGRSRGGRYERQQQCSGAEGIVSPWNQKEEGVLGRKGHWGMERRKAKGVLLKVFFLVSHRGVAGRKGLLGRGLYLCSAGH